MQSKISKRRNLLLHRVKIVNMKGTVLCPINCDKVESCMRCNEFYEKCTIYEDKILVRDCECGSIYAPVYWNVSKQKFVCQTCYGVPEE